jgi:ribonuclease BN (tRNA processing enzyme)
MLELSFLGSGGAFAIGGRYWSSFVVNRRYVFEAPPTLLPHLKRMAIPVADIHAVFITHFHGDHFMGLPFLFLEYAYLTPRRDDLYIAGPPGVQALIEGLAETAFPGLSHAEVDYQRRYLEAKPGPEQALDDVRFLTMPMNHANGKLTALGYRLHLDGKVLAYSGDTQLCDELFALAEGADVLIVDCSYCQGEGPEHMGIADIMKVKKTLSPSTAIILTHLDTEPDSSCLDGLLVAHDFATFSFP